MAEEIGEGSTYLKTPKSAGGPPAATAAAPAAEIVAGKTTACGGLLTNSSAPGQFSGPEKRRSPRYQCKGSIELRVDGCEARTWTSFIDVSMHGCYVEAQSPYPVGTILHMRLELDEFKVETKGEVRVNYPSVGMGIAFTDMSEENRTHLKKLVGSIMRSTVVMGPGIASALPATGPLEAVPLIWNAEAAVQALIKFFESRPIMMRDDFLKILHTSQSRKTTP
jgi:hypothetical protein